MSTEQRAVQPATLDDVRGWFFGIDRFLFVWLLERQERTAVAGDLIEMGAYLGRSAILVADYLRDGEVFTVCDLFDSPAPDAANSGEMDSAYRKTLTREAFDANYLAFHDTLPNVVEAPTSVLSDGRTAPGSARFIHIDASHLYHHVIGDIRFAKDTLTSDGIVVLDDYRSEHTPGVSAAVWEAVATLGLLPVVVTQNKFYGTWGDPDALQDALVKGLADHPDVKVYAEQVSGRRLLRLSGKPSLQPPEFRHSRYYDQVMAERARQQAESDAQLSRRAKRIAKDLLPPFATRALRNARSTGGS